MTDRPVGIPDRKAADMIQREPAAARAALGDVSFASTPIQPLPAGEHGRVTPAAVGIEDAVPLNILLLADSGGVKDPNPQKAVATAMAGEKPHFALHAGDIVYFNGDDSEYAPQFAEPYEKCLYPFLAVPGNHDGDTTDDQSRPPLDTFMKYWCSPKATVPAAWEEFNRATQTLPWCDWTLDAKAATIIGLYSNVPSGGHLEDTQVAALVSELEAADAGKPVILVIHHPPYSVDAHHGGSKRIADALDGAFEASKRCPNLVVSGHVHDYQRFTRSYWGLEIPYLVVGNSGYHNLHQLASDARAGEQVIDGVTFEYGDAGEYGYVNLTVAADGSMTGAYNGVTPGPASNVGPMVTKAKDKFVVAAR